MGFRLIGSAAINPEVFYRTGTLGVGAAPGGLIMTSQTGEVTLSISTTATTENVTITEVSAIANCQVDLFVEGDDGAGTYVGRMGVNPVLTTTTNLAITHLSVASFADVVVRWYVYDFGS